MNQTFSDFELIISDNASDDQTAKICEIYVKQDKRISYVKQSKNIAALGLGRNVKSELLRSKNGLWKELTPPPNLEMPELDFSDDHRQLLTQLNACDFLVFETFTEGRLRSRMHANIENVFGRDVELNHLVAIILESLSSHVDRPFYRVWDW